ncbi:MAG: hypothetical protein V3U74_03210 [Thermodesulfobacteriota bacterium]
MRSLTKGLGLLLVVMLVASFGLVRCGGGGGRDGSESTGTDTGQTTTIRGQVTDVVAKASAEQRSYMLSLLNDFLTHARAAHAQDGDGDLSGIMVEVFVDGELADIAITEMDGTFTLEFTGGGTVLLVFSTSEFEVSIEIFVPEGGTVTIVVNLQVSDPEEEVVVEVVEEEEENAVISCTNGELDLSDMLDENGDLMIDGGGNTCIFTAGNCELTLEASNVVLTNCANCIDSRGTSEVEIMTTGMFICEADGDGIHSVGTSEVEIEASEEEAEEACEEECDAAVSDCQEACDEAACEQTCTDDCTTECDGAGDPEVCQAECEAACDIETCVADCETGCEVDCSAECEIEGDSKIEITAGEDGIDARGNADVSLEAEGDSEESMSGQVTIDGEVLDISARGNAEVEVSGASCSIEDIETRGNAVVEIECGEEE